MTRMKNNLMNKIAKNNPITQSLRLLPRTIRNKFLKLTVVQVVIGILDLLSVALFGVLGALVINGVSSRSSGDRISKFLKVMQLENFEFRAQAMILVTLALLVSVTRTVLTVTFTRRTLILLSKAAAEISIGLFSNLIKSNIRIVQKNSSQEILYALSRGVDVMVVQVLGTSSTLLADLASLLIIILGLFIVDPSIALSTLFLFGGVGILLYKFMRFRARSLAVLKTEYEIKSNSKVMEALMLFREIYVHNRQNNYSIRIADLRRKSATAIADALFLPSLSKFIIEICIVIGTVLIGISQFILNDAYRAMATLGVFLAAGTKIAPAVLRIQQGFLSIRSNSGQIEPTLKLMSQLQESQETSAQADYFENTRQVPSISRKYSDEYIQAKDISFKYSELSSFVINKLSLSIKSGSMTAIVGGSGAGKSTLVDLLLGVLNPNTGSIKIAGFSPETLIKRSPGSISYVPQEIFIIEGSIRENICIGLSDLDISDGEIWSALKTSKLDSHVATMDGKLDAQVGERGNKLSGGQRQRLGLARALVTKPKFLVLDEATSALDAATEVDIVSAINSLRGDVTVLIVAHRLSSVRSADQVIYMDKGSVTATGTFEEVRKKIPDFDLQSKLMGL